MSYYRTLKESFEERNKWLIKRLDTIIPYLLDREDIDMWIVIGKENNEGPVLKTMLPQEFFGARGKNIFVFVKDTTNNKIHRFSISRPLSSIDKYYESVWYKPKGKDWKTYYNFMASRGIDVQVNLDDYKEETEYECLYRIVEEYNPKNIALNYSDDRFADGISYSEYKEIESTLGSKYSKRIVSARGLCIGWLESRIDEEIKYYEELVELTQSIIDKAYSRQVITPGVTTNTDVRFFMMQEALDRGAGPWFEATVWVRRKGESSLGDDNVIIQEGDILHCDFGIEFMGLHTDMQQIAYIAKTNEVEIDPTVIDAHKKANSLQDCVVEEIALFKSGNDILMGALSKAKEMGLKASVYTHPIGYHGHGAGPSLGRFDCQKPMEGAGEYLVYPNTMYALELNVTAAIESWDNQEIMYGLETDIIVKEDGSVQYFGKRQTEPYFVK